MIIVLTGATGTGKSNIAIELAKEINGEIINADAFQVYEKLVIATAAPSEEQKKIVPHHLFAYVGLEESYDIARYQIDCRNKINEVLNRGKTPILVGGSGLYIRSALYDYDLSVDTSSVNMDEYNSYTNEELHQLLEKVDPDEANKIHSNNRRRVERALQIYLATGQPKSELIAKQNHEPIFPTKFYVLKRDRNELYEHVNKRVDIMFEEGLLEETVPLIEKYGRDKQAFKAIGVKELYGYLDGNVSLEDSIELIKKETRKYIKRQDTFFRHQFNATDITCVEDIINDINVRKN